MSALGDRIRALRDERGMTNAQLAEAAGWDEMGLQELIDGEIVRPGDYLLRELASSLGVDFQELLDLAMRDMPPEGEGMAKGGGQTALAAVATEIGRDAAEWIQLMPAGEVRTRAHDGRDAWQLKDLPAVVAATRAVGLPLVIDYEHQTEHAKSNGQPAPAAGWIDQVEARADGVWGRAKWTDRARAMIAAGEYRFLSPVFRYDPKSREVRRIVMAGLTNDRALADIQALARAEGTMDELRKKLIRTLGLAEDADETAIARAVTALKDKADAGAEAAAKSGADGKPGGKAGGKAGDGAGGGAGGGDDAAAQALAHVAAALGLQADAKPDAVEQAAAKAAASKAGADGSEEVASLKAELAELRDERAEEKAQARVDAAMADGRIVPAQREWALGYAKRDPEGFDAFVKGQPQLLRPGQRSRAGEPPKRTDGPLSSEERSAAKALGISEDEYRASAKALADREDEEVGS